MKFDPEPQDPPGLEFAFAFRVKFSNRVKIGTVSSGFTRGYTGVVGGDVAGPKLNGIVVPHSGGDWPAYWPNGAVEFTAFYMLQADDGTQILVKNRGFRYASPEVTARMERLDPVEPHEYYMRLCPTFEAPEGKHDWMNRTVFIGTGNRQADHSIFRFWKVA
ncbi:DUF3237 family protein [Variovorax sp. PBL-E5]|uniref:DUF3237 family protein n=1 Tax=Variovorax sp. PBL-E5 TaxID=434014 RepID=UPI001318B121|nr:DUF3237 family protein [Variovorax sp. PBL-E5]VTU45131.1 hypothetical protein E5P2_00042 [Variovorax sp. PBL-E5]